MNIVLVMSEASLWKPQFVEGIIKTLSGAQQVVGMVLTSFRPRKSSKWTHTRRYFIMLGFRVFFLMAVREIFHTIGDIIDRHIRLSKYHSIEGVCRRYDIPVFKSRNVNNKNTIDWIQQLSPDILLSSGNQIFRKKLLSVSKIACLNRHTSLLPAYKGIYPIFWCLLNDEEFVGVSVHTMTAQIDQGKVVAQERLRVQEKDTFFSLFEKCFELSVDVVCEAIDRAEKGELRAVESYYEDSYYSYPTWQDVKAFRRKGKRLL
jgi:methionyl-tRNA formyltransferase